MFDFKTKLELQISGTGCGCYALSGAAIFGKRRAYREEVVAQIVYGAGVGWLNEQTAGRNCSGW